MSIRQVTVHFYFEPEAGVETVEDALKAVRSKIQEDGSTPDPLLGVHVVRYPEQQPECDFYPPDLGPMADGVPGRGFNPSDEVELHSQQ